MFMSDTFTEARENLEKNRGTPGLWFEHRANYRDDPPKPRVRYEAIEISKKNQPNLTTAALAGFADRPDLAENGTDANKLRLRTSEAHEIASKSKSQTDKWYDFEQNLNYQPPVKPPRIGAGTDGQTVMDQMTHQVDWFRHEPDRQDLNGHNIRRPSTSSGYARRNQATLWFAHQNDLSSHRCQQRVRYEGLDNAMRDRGTEDLLSMKQTSELSNSKVPYGCPSYEAQLNSIWSRKGSDMAICFGRSDDRNHIDGLDLDSSSSALKLRSAKVGGSEAEEWRERGRNGCMGQSMFLGTKLERPTSSSLHNLRPDGGEIYQKMTNNSQLMNCLRMTQSSRKPMTDVDESPAVVHRRLPSEEAEEAWRRNRGQMSDFLGRGAKSVTNPSRRKFQVRSLPSSEAQEYAFNNKGSSLKQLITNDHLSPESVRKPFANLTPEARDIAQSNQQGLIRGLLGQGRVSNIPLVGVEAPAQRRLKYEAMDYAERNQGQDMRDILKPSG